MLDWSRAELAEGLTCYRAGQFFEAHEHWESVWLTLQEPEKSFLQSLIQITAAFHHLQRGNRTGAASLLRRAYSKLARYPADFGGIEVAPLRADVTEWLHGIESGSTAGLSDYPSIRPVEARQD